LFRLDKTFSEVVNRWAMLGSAEGPCHLAYNGE